MSYKLSRHAQEEMLRRNIPSALVDSVMRFPEQVVSEQSGRKAYQSQLDLGSGKMFLLRAIVEDSIDPMVVITVYRTSNISKYWRMP